MVPQSLCRWHLDTNSVYINNSRANKNFYQTARCFPSAQRSLFTNDSTSRDLNNYCLSSDPLETKPELTMDYPLDNPFEKITIRPTITGPEPRTIITITIFVFQISGFQTAP